MNKMGPRLFDGPGFGRPSPARYRQVMDGRGAEYAADYFEYVVNTGALAANAATVLTINIERNSAFEWMTLKTVATEQGGTQTGSASVLVTISDSASGRNLMNAPTPLSSIASGMNPNATNGLAVMFPFVLPIARRFMPATQVSIALTEVGGNNFANIQLVFGGRKIWMEQFQKRGGPPPLTRFNLWQSGDGRVLCEDLFIFTFDSGPNGVPAAAPVPITQIMQADGDFEWILTQGAINLNNFAFDPAGTQPLSMQVRDVGSGRDLFTSPAACATVTGYGGTPYILPIPRITLAKSPMTVTLTDDGISDLPRVWITLIGRKLFEQD